MTIDKQDYQGLSDLDRANEHSAMRLEKEAHEFIQSAIHLLQAASVLSELKRDELIEYANKLDETMKDYGPSTQQWREAIAAAREGNST